MTTLQKILETAKKCMPSISRHVIKKYKMKKRENLEVNIDILKTQKLSRNRFYKPISKF
jgi:hypothetical protein